MKKLMLFILGIVFIGANSLAQVTARTVDQHVLPAKRTFYEYTGVAADTCGTEKDSLYFEIEINKSTPVNFNVRVEVSRTGTTAVYDIDLEGKRFENDSWSKIVELATQSASVTIAEPSTSLVDSINQVTINSGASDNFYRYFRILVNNDGSCEAADQLLVDAIIWKFYER